jgi:hypothetical protein
MKKNRFAVDAEWEEQDDNYSGRSAWLVLTVSYDCPIDKFWDDDLKEALASDDLLKAVKAGKDTLPRITHYRKCYDEAIPEIMQALQGTQRWKLTRDFGSPNFCWLREFNMDMEPEPLDSGEY